MKTLASDETARVAKQREELGKDGLKEKADGLQKATEENEVGENRVTLHALCDSDGHSECTVWNH